MQMAALQFQEPHHTLEYLTTPQLSDIVQFVCAMYTCTQLVGLHFLRQILPDSGLASFCLRADSCLLGRPYSPLQSYKAPFLSSPYVNQLMLRTLCFLCRLHCGCPLNIFGHVQMPTEAPQITHS